MNGNRKWKQQLTAYSKRGRKRATPKMTTESGRDTVREWRAELAHLLQQPVRSRFSAKYLTSGTVNMAQALVDGAVHDAFIDTDTTSALQALVRRRPTAKAKKTA